MRCLPPPGPRALQPSRQSRSSRDRRCQRGSSCRPRNVLWLRSRLTPWSCWTYARSSQSNAASFSSRVRVDLGDLDRRDLRVVRDDVLQRGVGRLRRTQAGARERDAGLAFPVHRLLFEFRERLGVAPLIEADPAKGRVVARPGRLEQPGRREFGFGLVVGTGVREQARQPHMTVDGQRVQRNDASAQRDRFVDPPVDRGEPARGMQSRRVAGCQIDRLPERRIGALPVEVVRREDLPQRDEPFDEVRRQGQRALCRRARPRVAFRRQRKARGHRLTVRPGKAGPGQREVRLQRDGLPEELDRARVVVAGDAIRAGAPFEVELVGDGVAAAALRGLRDLVRNRVFGRGWRLRLEQRAAQFDHDRLRDVVLHGEDVRQLAVVGLRPEMRVRRHLDQLRGDPHAIAGLADAALEQVRDAELLGDRRDVGARALEAPRRRARRHAQALDLREDVQQFLGQSVGEVLVLLVAAHVDERQHRDRRHARVERREQRAQRRKRLRQRRMRELVDRLPAREVLQAVLAQRLQRRAGGQPVVAQLARDGGDQRLPAMARGQEARDVVERRAEVVAVAQFRGSGMQRDPDADRRLRRPRLGPQRLLRGERRLQRQPRRGERRVERVACGLEHVAAARLDVAAQDRIVPGERGLHRVGRRLPHARAALDVREQERQRAGRRWSGGGRRHRERGTVRDPRRVFWAVRAVRATAGTGARFRRAGSPVDRQGRSPNTRPRERHRNGAHAMRHAMTIHVARRDRGGSRRGCVGRERRHSRTEADRHRRGCDLRGRARRLRVGRPAHRRFPRLSERRGRGCRTPAVRPLEPGRQPRLSARHAREFPGSRAARHRVGLRPVRIELPRLAGIGRPGRVRRQRRRTTCTTPSASSTISRSRTATASACGDIRAAA